MVNSSRTAEVQSVLPDAKVVSRPEDLIHDPDLDLIINCAPNEFHYSLTAAALEAGKHVVVEKPFVNAVEDGERLIGLASRCQKVLSIFHNRRWDGDFLTVRKLIQAGALGTIKHFESHMDRWRPQVRPERWREQPQAGSGLFYDLGPHLLDQALQLFGLPEKLAADIHCQKDNGQTDDYFHLILYYGKLRVILQSSSFTAVTPRFQIFGDRANFVKYGVDPQESQLKDGMTPKHVQFGREPEPSFGKLIDPESGATQSVLTQPGTYQKFYEDLHLSLTADHEVPVPAKEAVSVIRLIELARKSSETGTVINLP